MVVAGGQGGDNFCGFVHNVFCSQKMLITRIQKKLRNFKAETGTFPMTTASPAQCKARW